MLPKLPPKIIEHANGGKGRIILQPIAGPEVLKDKCRVYVKATLEKGCSMGVHQHRGDGEIYYILSGHGIYTDNDSTYEVKPGGCHVLRKRQPSRARKYRGRRPGFHGPHHL